MANPYAGLFSDVSGGWDSTAPPTDANPYAGMFDLGDPLALQEEINKERQAKRAQIAATWGAAASGQNEGLGRVATPDTSLPGVVAAGVDLAGATAVNALVGSAGLPRLPVLAGEKILRDLTDTPQDRDARNAAINRVVFGGDGTPQTPLSRDIDMAMITRPSAVPDPLAGVQQMTQEGQDAATQRLAEASTDLPTPLAAGGFWGATTAGLTGATLGDPLAMAGSPGLRQAFGVSEEGLARIAAEDAAAELAGRRAASVAAQRATAPLAAESGFDFPGLAPQAPALPPPSPAVALSLPVSRKDVEAAVARGVEPVKGDIGLGTWLDRAGLSAEDLTPDLESRYFDLQNPDVQMTRPTTPSPDLVSRFPGATIDARDVFEGEIPPQQLAQAAGGQAPLSPSPPSASPALPQDSPSPGQIYAFGAPIDRPPVQPGEAGFIRNPWAPESPLYQQGYQIRHDYVTDQNAAAYSSGLRSQELQQAIPSPAIRQDMTALFHGTGNPLIPGDTLQAAQGRIASSPYAQQAVDAIATWRQRSDELWQMARDSGADDLGYWKDYLHMVYEPPEGEKAIVGSDLGQGVTTSVMKERHFANPAEAMALGYKPKSLDFSVLMHETEKAHAYTRAVLGLVDDIGEVNDRALAMGITDPPIVRAKVNPNPESYVRVSGYPILENAAPGRVDPEAIQMARKLGAEAEATNQAVQARRFQPLLPGTEDLAPKAVEAPAVPETPPNLYIHRDLWRNLSPVLEHDNPTALDKALSVVKRINFFGSLFHGMSLTEAAMGSMGPLRGGYEAVRRGLGIPGLSQLAARLGSGRIGEDSALEAIRAGVNVEPPRLDVMQSTFDRMLQEGQDKLFQPQSSPFMPRNLLAKALAATRKTAAFYDEALWGNYHAPLKVTAYHVNVEKALASPKIQALIQSGELTPDAVRQSVARQVNNQFGGQNWQLLQNDLFSNPKATRWMRHVFLSPDWNYSAISTGLSPFSADPVARQMGMRYWKNMLGVALGWQTLNHALSGHFMWDNEPGHAFDLETGLHDDKGRKVFYQVGKHAMETPDFLFGRERATGREFPVAGFLLRKLNPVLQGVGTAIFGKSSTGIPGALERAREDADKEGRPLSSGQEMAARVQDLASGLVPFVSSDVLTHDQKTGDYQTHPGAMVRRLLIPFSERKGMSLHDGQMLMAEALRNRDFARAAQIRGWLHDNGYIGKQISRATSAARGQARKYPGNEDDGGDAPTQQPGTGSDNPYAGMFGNNGGSQ